MFRTRLLASCLLLFPSWLFAQKQVALAELAQTATASSSLTQPGSEPFKLRATIIETTNPDSGYKGEVEEEWVSPEKWRRTVKSPDFSQTIIQNGQQYSEQNTGEYYPTWLRNFVTALFDPLPMRDLFKQTNSMMMEPGAGPHSVSCARFQSQVGTPPARNSVFSVFCFTGRPALLESIVTPGVGIEFNDYKDFGKKHVARRLVSNPEPGTTIEAKVVELQRLSSPDDSLFAVQAPTPANTKLLSFQVNDVKATAMLLDAPPIQWPTIRSGKTSGVLSVFVSTDREGKVREAWPLNSDNAGLDDSVRAQVMKWRFKPAVASGTPVQLTTILTFAFDVNVANPIHVLTNAEARQLATRIVEPRLPRGEYTIRISVNADGDVIGSGNPHNLDTQVFLTAAGAVRTWKFRPYLNNGKPDNFDAEITFTGN